MARYTDKPIMVEVVQTKMILHTFRNLFLTPNMENEMTDISSFLNCMTKVLNTLKHYKEAVATLKATIAERDATIASMYKVMIDTATLLNAEVPDEAGGSVGGVAN